MSTTAQFEDRLARVVTAAMNVGRAHRRRMEDPAWFWTQVALWTALMQARQDRQPSMSREAHIHDGQHDILLHRD